MTRRLALFALVPVMAITAALVYAYYSETPPPEKAFPDPRNPVLPDLGMPKLRDVRVAYTDSGSRRIVFSATILNAGRGPLSVRSVRANSRSSNWLVTQRFRERDGSTSESTTPGTMDWGGHGHDHWHVKVGASYTIEPADERGTVLRRLVKAGYCFIDQERLAANVPGSPAKPRFPKSTCGRHDDVIVEQGLSPGWADTYFWLLPDQAIDITGLPDGRYRLATTSDPDGWFRESNETNNDTWVEFRLRTIARGNPRIDILRYGPSLSTVRAPRLGSAS